MNINNYKYKKTEKKTEKKIFISLIIIVLILNLILLICNKNIGYGILLYCMFGLGLLTIYYILKDDNIILKHIHNIFLILTFLGSMFFKNIYLSFIIFILIITFVSREILNFCLFLPDQPKTPNGTYIIIILIIIILMRIYFQKLYKSMLKF
jgi:hypothetical protein